MILLILLARWGDNVAPASPVAESSQRRPTTVELIARIVDHIVMNDEVWYY